MKPANRTSRRRAAQSKIVTAVRKKEAVDTTWDGVLREGEALLGPPVQFFPKQNPEEKP
ncbi:MAG: hypothetical protein IMZ62_17330 [Chloroflexi bacterium]|nr:hypothetical protein [Chloroflexota bacterium]